MTQIYRYVNPPSFNAVNMFKINYLENNITTCPYAFDMPFNNGHYIPLWGWDNDLFLKFINDIENDEWCDFDYKLYNGHTLGLIFENKTFLYDKIESDGIENIYEFYWEPGCLDAIMKMYNDIEIIKSQIRENKDTYDDYIKSEREYKNQYSEPIEQSTQEPIQVPIQVPIREPIGEEFINVAKTGSFLDYLLNLLPTFKATGRGLMSSVSYGSQDSYLNHN